MQKSLKIGLSEEHLKIFFDNLDKFEKEMKEAIELESMLYAKTSKNRLSNRRRSKR